MSGFPLYDNLIKDLPKKDLSVKEKEEFIRNIKKINMDGRELVYVLIFNILKNRIQANLPH